MKKIFIPVKINQGINEKELISSNLPKKIAIAYSIQNKETAQKIKEILSKSHKITGLMQVLGCSKPKISEETEAILLVSSGYFHAISLASETNLPIYIWDFNKLKKVLKEEVISFNKKKRASYLKFLNSEIIGIIVSNKPGQENLQKAIFFKKSTKKKSYLFLSNNINIKEFENFNIDSWVNTACPRLDFDSSIINLKDILKL